MSFKTICCVGDSIANGYWCDRGLGWFGRMQEMIALKYPKQYGFNNLAMSGDRTWDVYHRLCGEVLTRKPDILLIAVGVNDLIRWEREDGATDQSPQSCHEAWHRLLPVATANIEKILVIGLLPNVESRYPCTGYDDATLMWHKNSDIMRYNAEIKTWCEKAGVAFLDNLEIWQARDYESLFEDGGHPNGTGHQVLAETVLCKLESLKWVG